MTYVNPVTVVCKFCGAAQGEPCPTRVAHASRIEAAALQMGLSEAETAEIVRAELMTMVKRYRALHGESTPEAVAVVSASAAEQNPVEVDVWAPDGVKVNITDCEV